ncbi:uncharacterized protein LOC144103902 isoform X2 [Amblyomma americanum]
MSIILVARSRWHGHQRSGLIRTYKEVCFSRRQIRSSCCWRNNLYGQLLPNYADILMPWDANLFVESTELISTSAIDSHYLRTNAYKVPLEETLNTTSGNLP